MWEFPPPSIGDTFKELSSKKLDFKIPILHDLEFYI